MLWASAMEHVTFSLAMVKWKTIARKRCTKNARIPVLGCGASLRLSFLQPFSYIMRITMEIRELKGNLPYASFYKTE